MQRTLGYPTATTANTPAANTPTLTDTEGETIFQGLLEVGSPEVEVTDGKTVVGDEREDVDVRAEEWFAQAAMECLAGNFREAIGLIR